VFAKTYLTDLLPGHGGNIGAGMIARLMIALVSLTVAIWAASANLSMAQDREALTAQGRWLFADTLRPSCDANANAFLLMDGGAATRVILGPWRLRGDHHDGQGHTDELRQEMRRGRAAGSRERVVPSTSLDRRGPARRRRVWGVVERVIPRGPILHAVAWCFRDSSDVARDPPDARPRALRR
jgi:hypothetical protein